MLIKPTPDDSSLTRKVTGIDNNGAKVELRIIEERPITLYLNSQEIVTSMTIGDYPEYLALGFLKNQSMLVDIKDVKAVEYDAELGVVIVRTYARTNYEEKLAKKTRTSGCAVGTVFGDMMEGLDAITLANTPFKEEWLFSLSKDISQTDSLYLEAGAIHGTVLCKGATPLIYMEDVGRHNAVDKIAGWMMRENVKADDKILYTTGRLTSEMVIKTITMRIPVLVSRSGFTAWGVEIARKMGLTLIGRLRGKRYILLSGENRLIREKPAS